MIINATVESGYPVVATLALMASLVEVVYYLRVTGRLYFKPPRDEVKQRPVPLTAMIPLAVLGATTILVGLNPDWIMKIITPAAGELLQYSTYIKQVLATL